MTKPILWLGPLEEIDADFDPLLGRSAKEVAAQAAFTPSASLRANRSVFDDPDTFAAPTPPEPATVNDPFAFDKGSPEPTNFSVEEPSVAPNEPPAPATTYLTDPTPTDPPALAETQTSEAPLDDDLGVKVDGADRADISETDHTIVSDDSVEAASNRTVDEAAEPQKSFFTRLFTRKEIAPAVALGGASINEIWAKATPVAPPEPEPVPEFEAQEEEQAQGLQEEQVEALSEVEAAPLHTEETVLASEPEPEPEQEVTSQSEPQTDAVAEAVEADANPVLVPELAPEPEMEIEAEQVEALEAAQTVETPEAHIELETPVEANEVAHANMADDVASPEIDQIQEAAFTPETTVPKAIEPAPIEPIAEHPFSRAFNADKFWTLKSEQNKQPLGETLTGIEDLDPPEATSESLAVAEPEASVDPIPLPEPAQEAPVAIAAKQPEPLVSNDQIDRPARPPNRAMSQGQGRRKKVKKSYIGAFFGTFLFGVTLIMTLVSSLAALGAPFDLISSYRWYLVIMGVVSAAIFGISRGWRMVIASFAVCGLNLMVTVPASGNAPVGGKTANAVIGWANVNESPVALAKVIKDADAKGATLIMLAEAPASVFTPPTGWTLIEAPKANDPTAIAVLSKGSWRAVTAAGEPTMARPPAGDITIIGVHPHDAEKGRRSTPIRDGLINRAGARAGIQDGPTIVLGDFNAAPWDRAMRQFHQMGNVTRVRCGGWAGGTYTQVFGLIGVATDHAYVRNVKVTHCRVGATLPAGQHKPIWLYVAPEAAPVAAPAQP